MKTVTVCIGNSDDMLSQYLWSEFYLHIDAIITEYSRNRCTRGEYHKHFSGCTNANSRYQSACWVFEIYEDDLDMFKHKLLDCRKDFQQDSVAIVIGNTEFV